jgi:hypothetical protein
MLHGPLPLVRSIIPSPVKRPSRHVLLRAYAALVALLAAVLIMSMAGGMAGHPMQASSHAATPHGASAGEFRAVEGRAVGPSHASHDARPTTPRTAAYADTACSMPCHAGGNRDHPTAQAVPSCCVLGCCPLALATSLDLAVTRAEWLVLTPVSSRPGKHRSPEPDERPPRHGLRA